MSTVGHHQQKSSKSPDETITHWIVTGETLISATLSLSMLNTLKSRVHTSPVLIFPPHPHRAICMLNENRLLLQKFLNILILV